MSLLSNALTAVKQRYADHLWVLPAAYCRTSWIACLLLLALLVSCGKNSDQDPAPAAEPQGPSSEWVRLNNRGVSLMGRFDYPAAAKAFAELYDQAPDWPLAQVNLAIATLNRQNPGDEEAALALLEPILRDDDEELAEELARASFIAGILQFNQGQTEQALKWFSQAASLEPEDAYANYFLGQTLLQTGSIEPALARFQQAAALDGYLRSAFYGQFLAHQRLGQRDQAKQMLAVYERLENNPRSRLAEIKYTRMGPLAMALAVAPTEPASQPEVQPEGPLFAEPVLLSEQINADHASVSVGVSADKSSLVARTTVVSGSLLWDCQSTGCSRLTAPMDTVSASAWADMDNSGSADRLLLGQGLWIQYGATGDWQQIVADDAQVNQPSWTDLTVLDADHDGDLDVMLNASDRPALLLSNNGNGSFRSLESYLPIVIGARQVLAADLDRDRDLDLLLISADGAHQVLLNDRLWQYQDAGPNFAPWQNEPMLGAALVDLDVDGQFELLSLTSDALVLWAETGAGWQQVGRLEHGISDADRLWLQDFSGSGALQILVAGADRWIVAGLDALQIAHIGQGRVLAPLLKDGRMGPGLLLSLAGNLHYLPPGEGRYPFVTLALSGLTDAGQSMRSNASGLGTQVIARGAQRWQSQATPPSALNTGQSLQPLALGLGPQDSLPAITLDWSDGVFQTEMGLKPGLHLITETQRQLASCPVLFQWDGQGYQFVTDVLGVGGIGFNTGYGQYAEPRPREGLLLKPLVPDASSLRLMLAEPMEELAYVDQVTVTALDFPDGWEPALDERMGTDQQPPSGELFWIRNTITPSQVIDDRGNDVTDALARADLTAAPLPLVEPQLAGLLTQPQRLTLTFEADLSTLNQAWLLLDGWVEYGYSQTSFAAWQQGRGYDAISLEIQISAEDGPRWQSWRPSFGYPAGMPRASSLPLGQLPAGVKRLRLTTGQQIYFDRVAIAETAMPPALTVTQLALTQATVKHVGFPRRSNGPQMQPDYTFSQRDTFWDTRYPRGLYTALGPAQELLQLKDNALVIIGPGDGLELAFDGPLPPLPTGYQRRWQVTFHGWAKDMDLYTHNGESVLPLPADPLLEPSAAATLHSRFNTRFRSGR